MANYGSTTRLDRSTIFRRAWQAYWNYSRCAGYRHGSSEQRWTFGQALANEWHNARVASGRPFMTADELLAGLALAELRAANAAHEDSFTRPNSERTAAEADLARPRQQAVQRGLRFAA